MGQLTTAEELNKVTKQDQEIWEQIEKGQTNNANKLTLLTEPIAKKLVSLNEHIRLDSLTEISDEVAEILSQSKEYVSLDGLTTLSEKAAESFSHQPGVLTVYGLTHLSEQAARSLARRKQIFSPSTIVTSQIQKYRRENDFR